MSFLKSFPLNISLIQKQKPKPKPAVLPTAGVNSAHVRPFPGPQPGPAASTPAAKRQSVPPPPPPPPPALATPAETDVPLYKALFAFAGQEGEMALAADDLVELVEKDDNGELNY